MYENWIMADDNPYMERRQVMGTLQRIALGLVIIGALNSGLISLFRYDLVASLFGGQGACWSRVVYGLVGISGLVCVGVLLMPRGAEHRDVVEARRDPRFPDPNLGTEFGEEHDLTRTHGISHHPDSDKNDEQKYHLAADGRKGYFCLADCK